MQIIYYPWSMHHVLENNFLFGHELQLHVTNANDFSGVRIF